MSAHDEIRKLVESIPDDKVRAMSDRDIETMAESVTAGRNPVNGRFVRGNPGGPGRPRRAIEADYLAALSEAVPLDRWRKIIERAVSDAEQGDVKAREWLAGYLAGKPTGNALRKIAVDELAGIDPLAESVRMATLLNRADPFARLLEDDDLEDDEREDDERE